MHQFPARFYDGETAGARDVFVGVNEASRELFITDAQSQKHITTWPLRDIRKLGTQRQELLSITCPEYAPDARLNVERAQDIALMNRLARSMGKVELPANTIRKTVTWIGGATAALVLMIFVIVPMMAAQLAVLIPAEREAVIGQLTLRQIERLLTEYGDGRWICDHPAGTRALNTMTARITQGHEYDYDLNIHVVDHDMINAFALPGGQVILMRGLIERAENPDQVAGVLAHELGHVINRDPIEQSLRAAGTAGLLSLILGDATGGTLIALMGENILNASYSRHAEARADEYALTLMQEANLSPAAFAEFFDILLEEHGDIPDELAWMSSHPSSEYRAGHARGAVVDGISYSSALTPQEWADLQNICAQ